MRDQHLLSTPSIKRPCEKSKNLISLQGASSDHYGNRRQAKNRNTKVEDRQRKRQKQKEKVEDQQRKSEE